VYTIITKNNRSSYKFKRYVCHFTSIQKAKAQPYIQATVAYGAATASLPSQIAYGEGLKNTTL